MNKIINDIARKIALEYLNKPEVFNFQAFECNTCGKLFDTEKGCLIHKNKFCIALSTSK